MVWDKCSITLHSNPDGFFYTNNIITGSVILEFKRKRKVQRIDLQIFGTSEAKWSRFSPTVPYIRVYSEKWNILDAAIDVFDNLNGKTVLPGVYTCQFHLFLQGDLPSTFSDSLAKIQYNVMIRSESPHNCLQTAKNKLVPFIVINSLDLNNHEEYKMPTIFEATKKMWNSNFSMYIKTYKGFAPKQRIPIEAIIQNENKVLLRKVVVTLIQKLEYSITSGYNNDINRLCSSECHDLLSKVSENRCLYLDIPPVVPSSINTSDPMVNISYSLEVQVAFRFHLALYSDIPVTIASVPVMHKPFVT